MNKSPILVLLCVLCLVLAGCSGGGGENPRDTDVTGMADSVYMDSTTPNFDQGKDSGESIAIKDMAFGPQVLTVEWVEGFRGGCFPCPQVTWTNNDDKPHTVTSDTGDFDSGPIGPGEQWMWTFTQSGTYDYHCTYHEEMTGTVDVVAVEKKSS